MSERARERSKNAAKGCAWFSARWPLQATSDIAASALSKAQGYLRACTAGTRRVVTSGKEAWQRDHISGWSCRGREYHHACFVLIYFSLSVCCRLPAACCFVSEFIWEQLRVERTVKHKRRQPACDGSQRFQKDDGGPYSFVVL